ncbi:MAG: tyrosine-type recombinase/integrase [Nitrospirae bacterium]|nr:tyrosine-type recombinase/integrase [Nitrospirota bacterium]
MKCPTCLTTPKRYYIAIYVKQFGQVRIYSDRTGSPLDSLQRARRVLDSIRYEMDQRIFDHTKYVASKIEEFKFEKQLEAWYRTKLVETEKGNLAESYTLKLRTYIDSYYLCTIEEYRSERYSHLQKLEDGELVVLKGLDVREIRRHHIQKFYEQLPPSLSLKYVKNIMNALENFFNTLVEDEIIDKRPAFPKIKIDQIPPKWINGETQLKMLNSIPIEDRPIFAFLMYQGVRPGEAAALKVKDISFNPESICITRTFSNRKIRERVKSKIVKLRGINPSLLEMLTGLCEKKFPENFVFVNPRTGRAYTDSALFRIWDTVRKKLGIKVTLYQATRHSLASIASNRGVPLQAIKEVLGHTSISTTMKYAHSNLESQQVVFQKSAQVLPIKIVSDSDGSAPIVLQSNNPR